MDYLHIHPSPLGPLTLASDGESLIGLWFEGQKHFGSGLSEEREAKALPVFEETAAWLCCYFSGGIPDFIPPVQLRGTPFQKRVWACLRDIPYGETVSYGELSRAAFGPEDGDRFVRAAAQAVGRNPVSILVPCHRVVGHDGSLTGYAGGIERKRFLLDLEKTGRIRL